MRRPTVSELSPDGSSRFYMMADILCQIYHGSLKPIRILDVGGGSEYLRQQLDKSALKYDLTVLDIIEKPDSMRGSYIQADATANGLPDKSYDVVVSTDTLEHIPAELKRSFVRECLRVSKEVCIIAAPFDTAGVDEAELAVNNFNKMLFGEGQDWLEEHFSFGKPKLEDVTIPFGESAIPFVKLGTQPLTTWLLNTHLNLVEARLGLDPEAHMAANRFYNAHLLTMGEFQPPTYRQFFVAFVDSHRQKDFKVEKYTKSATDIGVFVEYIHILMELIARRLTELVAEGASLTDKLSRIEAEAGDRQKKIAQLEAVCVEQQELLNLVRPIIRLAKTRPARKLLAVRRDFKKRGLK